MAKTVRPRPRAKKNTSGLRLKWNMNNNVLLLGVAVIGVVLSVIVAFRARKAPGASTETPLRKKPDASRSWKLLEDGSGIVATRDFTPGTMILLDTPWITIERSENTSTTVTNLAMSLNTLSQADKLEFFDLSYNPHHLPGTEEEKQQPHVLDLALNIFEYNAVPVDGNYSAIFRNAAHIRHSCLPNADLYYREDLDAVLVQAVQDITAGEEIHVPYFDTSRYTRAHRQEYLNYTYGFECHCKACSMGEQAIVESDKRRSRLFDLLQQVFDWAEKKEEPDVALAGIDEAFKLLEEENYSASLRSWAANAMGIGAAYKDSSVVRKWASVAVERYAIETGKDSREVAKMKLVYENPEIIPTWGTREERVL